MSTEVQQASLWAFRSLRDKDSALRSDVLRAPTDEYTVPASAGLVAAVCKELSVDPVKGAEGDEVWRHLRGRPVNKLYEFFVEAKEAADNEDIKEVYRLVRKLGNVHPDVLSSSGEVGAQ